MAVLTNARHERFAQEIAKGTEAGAAYKIAGFTPNGGNARRLKLDEAVRKRVEAILSERARIHEQGVAKAIEKVCLSKEWVIERLIENANRAMQAVEIRNQDGGTGEYKYDGAVANKALELLGKEIGMFIDRKEVGAPGEFDGLNLEEKRERAASLTRQLGLDRISPRTPVDGNA